MLQIVTKMYFRDGVPLHSTEHRNVLYTNCGFLRAGLIELPVGTLAPSTELSPVSTVTVSITEHLEAEELDGTPARRISTGGLELFDDLGVVLSFALNAVFSRNHDLVRRLVPDAIGTDRQTQASRLFGRMFEAHRYVPEAEFDEFRSFMTRLLALKREHFEAAMRAIKRIVGATQRAADDPTLAYVDIVAALESLSAGVEGPLITWDRMDARKRGLIDEALVTLESEAADRVRTAVVEADRLGVTARFLAFVLNNVSPGFFREEAVGVENPVRRADLERVVKQAYEIRSLNVHVLKELRFEAWILGSQFETVTPAEEQLMLTHVGLARLARHVVKNYVASAPVGTDLTFNWRAYLPGQLIMPLAPQYWVWHPAGFDHRSVARYFSGFVQHLVDALARRNPALPDMTGVLERIERLVPGTKDGSAKTMMLAIYVLWHRVIDPDHHRAEAEQFLEKYEAVLHPPGMPAFVAWLLSGSLPNWSTDQWQTLAMARWSERSQKSQLELPARLDAALQLMTAERLVQADKPADAQQHAAFAVEELPGNEQLLTWESALLTDAVVEIDPWEVAVKPEEDATAHASEEQTASGDSGNHETTDDGDPGSGDG